MIDNNNFKVETVFLEGSNLIEASAGTGKTYSIAILVLRLIIETDTPIEKILLVTFTEAAAAELKERTQAFIYLALKECKSPATSGNDTIKDIIKEAVTANINVESKLKAALLDLDKATISTIHGFCQQTLTEFAFETNQMYGKEVLKDTALLIEEEVNRYWREVVVKMEYDFLKEIGLEERGTWVSAVKNVMSGQKLPEASHKINNSEDLYKEYEDLIFEIDENIEEYRGIVRSLKETSAAKEPALKRLENAETLFKYVATQKSLKVDLKVLLPEISAKIQSIYSILNQKKYDTPHHNLQKACDIITKRINKKLEEKSLFTFDELIQKVYEAVNNENFKKLLRAKYSAVFVDEFQDTDKKQYAIFEEIFQKNEASILFFIGDPKQSIYGWRQADIKTYERAKESVENFWTMGVNYRSSEEFIKSANTFFSNGSESLNYIDVKPNKEKNKGLTNKNKNKGLTNEKVDILALEIIQKHVNETEISDSVESIFKLLFSKETKLNGDKLKKSNVAVLVRKGYQAKNIKKVLDDLNIPSVIINDQNIFNTKEAESVKEILTAILNISKSNIDRAMITPILGRKIHDLENVDSETLLQFFLGLKKIWEEKGIFKTLQLVLNYFKVQERFEDNKDIKGQQLISNTLQLIDLLQSVSLEDNLTPTECLQFLKDEIKNTTQNDAYVQRIESDEDAVTIMTIHKSKGLEFDVVVLPYMNLDTTPPKFANFSSYRQERKGQEENDYYFSFKKKLTDKAESLYKTQTIEENERLLYVALTRARYNAFLLEKGNFNKKKKTYQAASGNILNTYIEELNKLEITTLIQNGINLLDYKKDRSWKDLNVSIEVSSNSSSNEDKSLPKLELADKNYHKMSYSFLRQKLGNHTIKEKGRPYTTGEDYDQFIFETLPKGAHIGNLLHDIFEWSDFTKSDEWEKQVERSLGRLYPRALANEETKELYLKHLTKLMHHVINGKIVVNGKSVNLSNVARNKMIAELEFNFPIEQEMEQYRFNYVLDKTDSRTVNVVGEGVKGLMNGLIDLFFEYNGKYYILDWKSNYLGDNLHHYSPKKLEGENIDRLTLAMNESNYHLQYLLYTVAVDKYLNSRLADYDFEKHFGGVIYVFLRGARAEEKTGFFVQNVTKEEIDKMKKVLFKEEETVQ